MDETVEAHIDRLLAAQGGYAPVELLLALGWLSQADYAAWLNGQAAYLEDRLTGNSARIREAMTWAARYARQLRLEPQPCRPKARRFSRHRDTDALFATGYRRTARQPQLDLFRDSPATGLEHDLIQALAGGRRADAEDLLHRLEVMAPDRRLTKDLARLVQAQKQIMSSAADVEQECRRLQQEIGPLARKTLGSSAEGYLRVLRQGVRAAVERAPGWQSHGALLWSMAVACGWLGDRRAALECWCRLCWRFPETAAAALDDPGLPDPGLKRAWQAFGELEPELETAAFPAWLLLARRVAADDLPDTVPDNVAAARAFTVIRRLPDPYLPSGSGPDSDTLALRRTLQALHPGLFRHYLRQGR